MQPQLRKETENAREPQAGVVGASRNAAALSRSLREWARNLGIAALAGVFLALVGALGSDTLSLPQRLLYWVPLLVGGAAVAEVVARFVNMIPRAGASPWIFGAILSVLLAIPVMLIVWLYSALMFQQPLDVRQLIDLYGPVLMISAAMTAIMLAVNRPGRVTSAPMPDATPRPIQFMERLPAKLRGAAIYAVSSEDHYLRLHTSKGADLILMRLADAITELEGLEGAQTHRSWWVARDAVEDARRDGDRVTLRLKGDVEAPVSRPNIRPLREAGWF